MARSTFTTTSDTSLLPPSTSTPKHHPTTNVGSSTTSSSSGTASSKHPIISDRSIATTSSTNPVKVPNYQPIDDCTSLGTRYDSGPPRHEVYDIFCKKDYPTGSTILDIMTYTFEDCILGCASYNYNTPLHPNSTCIGVTYSATRPRDKLGTCWFQHLTGVQLADNGQVDTAVLIPS